MILGSASFSGLPRFRGYFAFGAAGIGSRTTSRGQRSQKTDLRGGPGRIRVVELRDGSECRSGLSICGAGLRGRSAGRFRVPIRVADPVRRKVVGVSCNVFSRLCANLFRKGASESAMFRCGGVPGQVRDVPGYRWTCRPHAVVASWRFDSVPTVSSSDGPGRIRGPAGIRCGWGFRRGQPRFLSKSSLSAETVLSRGFSAAGASIRLPARIGAHSYVVTTLLRPPCDLAGCTPSPLRGGDLGEGPICKRCSAASAAPFGCVRTYPPTRIGAQSPIPLIIRSSDRLRAVLRRVRCLF